MGNNPTEVTRPSSQHIVVFEISRKCYFRAKMKATYRRRCLLKSRGWQNIHSTHESKAGSKNECTVSTAVRAETTWDVPYGQADPPTHTVRTKSRRRGSDCIPVQGWTQGVTRMPHHSHRGLGDMLLRQAELVSVTSVRGRGGTLFTRVQLPGCDTDVHLKEEAL